MKRGAWRRLTGVGPVAMVRAWDAVPMGAVWLMHQGLLVIGGFAGLLCVATLIDADTRQGGWGDAWDELIEALFAPLLRGGEAAWLAAGAYLAAWVMVELGFVLAAVLTMAMSAGDEPMRRCFTRALRRQWLLTGHLSAWACVLMLGWAVAGWLDRESVFSEELTIGVGIFGWTAFWGMLGWLWLARGWSLRVDRWSCRWPACCTACGYELMGIGDGDTCPECGAPAMSSRWEPRRDGATSLQGVARWWGGGMIDALRSPGLLGERLWLRWPGATALRRFALALVGLWPCNVIGGSAFLVWLWLIEQSRYGNIGEFMKLLAVTAGIGTFVSAVVCLLFTGCAVACVGVVGRWWTGRNLLGPAWQSAAALSGGWWVGTLSCWGVLMLLPWAEKVRSNAYGYNVPYSSSLQMSHVVPAWVRWAETFAFTTLLIAWAVTGLVFVAMVARATWTARRANR